VKLQAGSLREERRLPGQDEETPAELNEDTQRLVRLFHDEEARRKARLKESQQRPASS
jgi:hypothetical protein